MIDVEISIESVMKKWRVELRSIAPGARALVDPLSDALIGSLENLPETVDTWDSFLAYLTPNDQWQPDLPTLKTLGQALLNHVLGERQFTEHLATVERRAREQQRPIRFVIEIRDAGDAILAALPLELAFDGDRFIFKNPDRPTVRTVPASEADNIRLGPGTRLLIATASRAGEPPSETDLETHALALACAAKRAGWSVLPHLAEVSPIQLEEAIAGQSPPDVLYVACHGHADADHAGQLSLRDGTLTGNELGKWLEVATERERQVKLVVLCACSSAVPQSRAGTAGMAEWLARGKRTLGALGFRGPVAVGWAMSFMEGMFHELSAGKSIDRAFANARYRIADEEPQWLLPLLYVCRADIGAMVNTNPRSPTTCPALPSRLPPPRLPRPYFTGRDAEVAELTRWLMNPGTAAIAAIEGQGGMGKTELALVAADEAIRAGRAVLWLKRPDHDLRSSLVDLVRVRVAAYVPGPQESIEAIADLVRGELGPSNGLLVLDDISDARNLDYLIPGSGWKVLVATRIRNLFPGVVSLEIDALAPLDAECLLARVAFDADELPAADREAGARLVETLGYLPLAIELAGATMRRELCTTQEYIESLREHDGVASEDRDHVWSVLTRALAKLPAEDREVVDALAVLPNATIGVATVAAVLGGPQPAIARSLSRLSRQRVVTQAQATEKHGLHPLLWRCARLQLRRSVERWNELHAGAGRALEELARWVRAPIGERCGLAQDRWRGESDVFAALDTEPWEAGAPGGDNVAWAIAAVDDFAPEDQKPKRIDFLTRALALCTSDSKAKAGVLLSRAMLRSCLRTAGASEDLELALGLYRGGGYRRGEANTLLMRGQLLQQLGRIGPAIADFEQALGLYATLDDRLGQANVLRARGHMRSHQGNLEGAASDYEQALTLYEAVDDLFGQVNILTERGMLRRHLAKFDGAAADYDRALDICEGLKYHLGRANVLRERGILRADRFDSDGAFADYAQALELQTTVHDGLGQANTLKARGGLRMDTGDLNGAAEDFGRALELFAGHDLGRANVFYDRATLRIRRGDLNGAFEDYEQALEVFRAIDNPRGEALVLKARGALQAGISRLYLAGMDYDGALKAFEQLGDPVQQAAVLRSRGDLQRLRGDHVRANEDYSRASRLYEALGHDLGQANVLLSRAHGSRAAGRTTEAEDHYRAALSLYRAVAEPLGSSNALVALADLHLETGNLEQARAELDEAEVIARRVEYRHALKLIERGRAKLAGD